MSVPHSGHLDPKSPLLSSPTEDYLEKTKNRKRKTKNPCQVCFLKPQLCICDLIPKLDLKTKISLIIHAKELKRTTNTGRLAMHALKNSEMYVRGLIHQPLNLTGLLNTEYETFLFYPSDEAIQLDQDFVKKYSKPIQLIVPDGNWRQASKVHHRHPELKDIKRVMIGTKNISTLHMRAEIKEEGMATLQAIAFALGIIEGQAVKDQLLNLYDAKLRRTLFGRGLLKAEDIK